MSDTPAQLLEGKVLKNGWTVHEKITRKKTSTGGHFSVGYRVINSDGRTGFLKALDFSSAMQTQDPLKTLQAMLEVYNFERDLLEKCKNKGLKRVLFPIEDGTVDISGFGIVGTVHYLVFELADGDIRDVLTDFKRFDLVWCLRSLHHVAVGLKQLHGNGVAHQDLKPSNVLFKREAGSKIGDLGRAADREQKSPIDSLQLAGDKGYAPLDLYYNDNKSTDFERRFLTDLYLFGSLFFFHFTGVSAVHCLRSKLKGSELSGKVFKEDLPYLQMAFEECLIEFRAALEDSAGDFADEITELVKQLCNPDPERRGDPRWRASVVPNYDLQRFISALDNLARRAEVNLA